MMEIPEELKLRLLSEIDFIIDKIRTENDSMKKVYFLSAVCGAFERTMRFYDNNEILITQAILQINYNAIRDRINLVKTGDTVVPIPPDLWEQLVELLLELRLLVNNNASTYPVVEKIMRLTYSMTGPGYYTLNYLDSQR